MESKYLAIGVAAILAVVISFLWYGVLFKNALPQTGKKLTPIPLFGSVFVLGGIVALGLWKQIIGLHAYIIGMSDDPTRAISEFPFAHGALHGIQAAIYFGVISAVVLTILFENKGLKTLFIHLGFWIITMTLMGGVVGWLGQAITI